MKSVILKNKFGKEIEVFRVKKNDINGNPRYIIHFLELDSNYKKALAKSRIFGGKKYMGKDFGGGIVFQSYNVMLTIDLIK